jgi:drug/metabolite transporter (DMT)-like permease
LVLDAIGFVASLVALHDLPLFLVESAVASSVGITAAASIVVLKVRLSRGEIRSLAIMTVGLGLLAVSAQPGPAKPVGSSAGWWLLAATAVLVLVVVLAVASARVGTSLLLAAGSGLGFGLVGIAARILHFQHPWWHTANDPLAWTIAVAGVLAMVAYGIALGRTSATTVAAIAFGVETVVPAVVGIALLGDTVRPHLAVLAGAGFVATLFGCIALARLTVADAGKIESRTGVGPT